ncbi:hypothetical protein [Haliangium sp. UPWRP_2]|uniref:hypothetical protein n=1 Tax=Haliangium sp. UPWRP_2 TaxID=1931276 RepID=UPI0011B23FC2|nr:hypothetical protein [Haliangium sp. UPWRP_2]
MPPNAAVVSARPARPRSAAQPGATDPVGLPGGRAQPIARARRARLSHVGRALRAGGRAAADILRGDPADVTLTTSTGE